MPVVLGACAALAGVTGQEAPADRHALEDREFRELVQRLSEPSGEFPSDNLVSNERDYLAVMPALDALPRGGAYLGVAPDQNFSYILATEPAVAFIVDIRRENLLQHLLYKAAIELSDDRANFLSMLFGRPRPAGVGAASTADELLAAFARVEPDARQVEAGLEAMVGHLAGRRGFPLGLEDREGLRRLARAFARFGPDVTYASSQGRGPRDMPSFVELQSARDPAGMPRAYLGSAAAYARLRASPVGNRIVPVVGDFAGNRALNGIAAYLARRGLVVSAFYTSNVEQYLFQSGRWRAFYRNVTALPLADHSLIIRSAQQTTFSDPIRLLLSEVERGRIRTYADITRRRPPGR